MKSKTGYLHMLEIRYYLSQPTSLDMCKEKYCIYFSFSVKKFLFFFKKKKNT